MHRLRGVVPVAEARRICRASWVSRLPAAPAAERFAALDALMEAEGGTRTLSCGQRLCRAGEPARALWRIEDGAVDLRAPSAFGGDALLDRVFEGAWLGAVVALQGAAAPVSAVAAGMVRARRLDARRLRAALADAPSILEAPFAVRDAEARRMAALATDGLTLPLPSRVARRLHAARDKTGEVHLTQSALGDLTGTTRASVARVLREMEARGLVERRYGAVIARDAAGLECFAAEHAEPG